MGFLSRRGSVPLQRMRRRREATMDPLLSLPLGTVGYALVAAWMVHAGMFAMLLRFETPSGVPSLCSYSNRWNHLVWYRTLREAAGTAPASPTLLDLDRERQGQRVLDERCGTD